jgi:hypothetical protein
MGLLMIVAALVLPVVAGAYWWPWWTILIAASLAFVGFITANYRRIEIVDGQGGVPRVIASALALNSIMGAALFEFGRLLSHL